MNPLLIFTLMAVVFITACESNRGNSSSSPAHETESTSYLPTTFEISDGGPWGGFAVKLESGEFWHSVSDNHKVSKRKLQQPSKDDWLQFWHTLGQAKVWRWRGAYAAPAGVTVDDGPVWRIRITLDQHRKVDASGRDAYPSDQYPSVSTVSDDDGKSFQAVTEAVSTLFKLK